MPSGPKAREPAHFSSALPDFMPAVAAPKTVAAVSIASRVYRMCSLQWFIGYHSGLGGGGPGDCSLFGTTAAVDREIMDVDASWDAMLCHWEIQGQGAQG